MLLFLVAVGVLAASASARMTSPPSAAVVRVTPSSPVTRGSGYVALGDSVSFGYQEPQVVPAPDYRRAASLRGFPEQLGTELHLRVANFACPGETAATLINARAPGFACETGYRKAFPLHVRYSGSQLTAAIAYLRGHRDVRLVSLMIGANDLFRCRSTTSDGCASELNATLGSISGHVKRILSAVRYQAGYRGQLVIVNYFSLDYASASLSNFSRELNHAQDTAAQPFHVRIADGFGELRTASSRFAGNPCLAGLLTQLGSYGNCGVHPSYAGQALLAKAVATAIRF
jgi:lysophospholipase L1-like esterase